MWSRYGARSIVWGRQPKQPDSGTPKNQWTLIQGYPPAVRWAARRVGVDTSGGTASKAQWTLIQGNRSHLIRWTGRRAAAFVNAGSFAVAGSITARFSVPPPQSFAVVGHIAFSVERIAGAVALSGAFNCAGRIDAVFTIPTLNSFHVAGDISANFYSTGGQMESCIAGPGVPAAEGDPPAPWNAAY